MAHTAPKTCFFFTDTEPVDGDLIHYGPSHSKEAADLGTVGEEADFGRWNAHLRQIIGADLRPFVLKGRRGYCWQLAGRRLIPAQLRELD